MYKFALFAILSLYHFNILADARSGCQIQKNIDFYRFPIVLKGQSDMRGFRNDTFAAYSFRNKKWTRIPIQIDEVNERGDFVLSDGLPYTIGTDDGFFDDNDELVFEGSDLGRRASLKSFPKELLKNAQKKWWVDICGLKYHGSFLLISYNGSKPFYFPPVRAAFNSSEKMVETQNYSYRFHDERAALLGQVYIRNPQGTLQQVFEQSYFVMPLKLPWYLPNFNLSNENFVSTIESWQVGSIRSIVAVGVKLQGFLSLFDFHMFSELIFYRNKFEIPTMIEFTMDPSEYFHPGSGIGYSIKFSKPEEWPIATNIPVLPSKTSEEIVQSERKADTFERFEMSSTNDLGSFAIQVQVDPSALSLVPPPFMFDRKIMNSSSHASKQKWLKDLKGDVGVFVDFSQVRKGIYKFGLDLFLSHEAKISGTDIQRPESVSFKKL